MKTSRFATTETNHFLSFDPEIQQLCNLQNLLLKMLSNLASTSKAVNCDSCGKQYTERLGLRKHMKPFHLIEDENPQFRCWQRNYEDLSVLNVKEHIRKMHGKKNLQWNTCIHDLSVFGDKRAFVDHMLQNHGHPVWENDREETQRMPPVETAFGGAVLCKHSTTEKCR